MTMQTSSLENVVKRFAREKGYVKLEELRKQIRRTTLVNAAAMIGGPAKYFLGLGNY